MSLSHDEDWMSVLEDVCPFFNTSVPLSNHISIQVDEELPRGVELLRRICGKFKFVAEGGTY